MAKISVATRAELKRDLDFLNKQKALQEGGMDKKTRKEFKLNLKHEMRYEEAKAAEVEELNNLNKNLNAEGQLNRISAQP